MKSFPSKITLLFPALALMGSEAVAQDTFEDVGQTVSSHYAPLIILFLMAAAAIILVRTILDSRLKRLLIEKGLVTNEVKLFFVKSRTQQMREALKWGLVIGGAGAGMVAAQFLPFGFISLGLILVSMSSGFLCYYVIMRLSDAANRRRQGNIREREEEVEDWMNERMAE